MDCRGKQKRGALPWVDNSFSGCYPVSDSDSDDGYAIKRRRRERRLQVDKDHVFSSLESMKLKFEDEHQGEEQRENGIRICSFEEHSNGIGMRYEAGELGRKNKVRMRRNKLRLNGFNETAAVQFPGLQKLEKNKSVVQQQPTDEVRMRRKVVALGFSELEKTLLEELEEKPTESLKESFRSKLMEMRKRREPSTPKGSDVVFPKCLAKLKIEEVDGDLRRCLAKLNIEETDEDLWKFLAKLKIKETDDDLRKGMEKLKEIAKQRQQFDNFEKIVTILCQIEKENSLGLLTLRSLANYFIDLKWRLSHDYKLYDLSCIAYSFALPFFTRVFQHWNPLQKPSHKLSVVSMWKDILQSEDSHAYKQLFSEVILPLESTNHILNSWEAGKPEQMLRFLECWEKLLPSSVFDFILDSIVMPKLSGAKDSWVRPWLPLLQHKREDLYKRINMQLG